MMPSLAHQGGWDELLILLSPVLIFAVLRVLTARRERRQASDRAAKGNRADGTDPGGASGTP